MVQHAVQKKQKGNEEMNRLEEFLNELSELTIKYDLVIGGCGCCGSPYIDELYGGNVSVSDLYFNYDTKKYEVEK